MPFLMSLAYLTAALALLAVCTALYLWMTPYKELELVRQGNAAAALSLGGAVLGLTLPVGSAIFFTHDLGEMMRWGAIGCAMQFLLFQIMRKHAKDIEPGNVAAGVLLFCLSLSTGMLVAMCIS